jgi:CheY-like chemotaxis protein
MENYNENSCILMVDDDEDDFLLVKEALEENGINNHLRQLADGDELLDYLLKKGRYSKSPDWSSPELILLDLNMPRKDGREALAEIKGHPSLRKIPIVVFTTSNAAEDIRRCYELGANTYINKPESFDSLVNLMGTVVKYWMESVELPSISRSS